MSHPRPDVKERHRRQRLATRARILEVTRELVEDRPWREVSIGLVTERADLTRTAFYKHFTDRRALLLALFAELGVELGASPGPWATGEGDGDPRAQLGLAVSALVETFERHGRLLQAIAEEATQDPAVNEVYLGFGAQLAEDIGRRVERDVAAGRTAIANPLEVVTALVWMNERYLRLRFGRRPFGDRDLAVSTLTDIWVRTIYS